jgi:hypothetical protein
MCFDDLGFELRILEDPALGFVGYFSPNILRNRPVAPMLLE